MAFEKSSFIKPNRELNKEYTGSNFAPMFRKTFTIDTVENAKLSVCGLGFGYYYINGQKVTEDLFTAPVSDYRKTCWYNVYDVSNLLHKGENVIAVWCGNGWYNEEFKTAWNYNDAAWRDVPKVIIDLSIGQEKVLVTDDSWKCLPESAITFNGLRAGETLDFRLFDEKWTSLDFDDSKWENAVVDNNPPTGELRQCKCEPIREDEVYKPIKITKTGDEKYLFDFGQNFSGYTHIVTKGSVGKELTIRHVEMINKDNTIQLNGMQKYYHETPFQTDKIILSGNEDEYKPLFCYHGFRYVEVEGIENIDNFNIEAIFVHQAVEKKTTFECSDKFLTKLFRAGQYSTLSNMFYAITDCPTREKLGWTNDAQSSTEQILTNFTAKGVLNKWLQDIYDNMRPDGCLSGTIPDHGWGYAWGNGPVSDGILFEIPYRIYLHTGDKMPLIESLPYFDRYFDFLEGRKDDKGYVNFGLDDWARPDIWSAKDTNVVPLQLINAFLMVRFNEIAAMATEFIGLDSGKYTNSKNNWIEKIKADYLEENGRCKWHKQTAVSMMIYYGIYDDIAPLKQQLKELVEEKDFHHDCGMVGMRRLFHALNMCGLEDYAYKILISEGHPSYHEWFEFDDATTLWELWSPSAYDDSKNHQMYSDFMSWIIKTVLGIKYDGTNIEGITYVDPRFITGIDYAKGSYKTNGGDVLVSWNKENEKIKLDITVPDGEKVYHKGNLLNKGLNHFEY